MLTSLDFLKPGQKWPPSSEASRLNMYAKNRELFESEHVKVYEEDLKRIERVIGNFEQVISYPIVLNFQKIMSLKIADLLLGEPPRFTSAAKQEALDDIIKRSDLINNSYLVCVDISRYGDGLYYSRRGTDGKGIIDITQPCLWFPVVDPDNLKEFTNHVLAWTYSKGENEKKQTFLKCQVHHKGKYEQQEYLLADDKMIDKLLSSTVVQTGLDDFAIIQASNIITSDRVTGIDDYTDIDSIVSDLMVRVGQVDKILDKHASPSMHGPIGALERDPVSGEWRFKAGNYIPTEKEDPIPGYITWEGQLEAAFSQIDKLINLLYTISEMGSAIFGDMKGSIPSGSALKRLMVSPLAKVNRIRMRLDAALKKAIILCGKINNIKLDDVAITWQDGLPADPVEEAQILATRMPGASTLSIKTALQRFDGMTEIAAEEEAAAILDEAEQMNPVQIPAIAKVVTPGEPGV
jgi:hypothetical protein